VVSAGTLWGLVAWPAPASTKVSRTSCWGSPKPAQLSGDMRNEVQAPRWTAYVFKHRSGALLARGAFCAFAIRRNLREETCWVGGCCCGPGAAGFGVGGYRASIA